MKTWSKLWNRSKSPSKQRKFRYNAPLHIRKRFMSASLSKELRIRYHIRNIPLRVGDKVKIMVGNNKDKVGKIKLVDLKNYKVKIDGLTRSKTDGSKVELKFEPSNLMITELNLDDEKRKKKIERKK